MPALKPTDHYATIAWLGRVPADSGQIRAEAVEQLELTYAGVEGGRHAGRSRPSCSRVMHLYERGTQIANTRQLTLLSEAELAEVAASLGLVRLDPALLGANLLVRGLADFSRIPPSSRLQNEQGTTLVVDMENRPCRFPAEEIEARHEGHGKAFIRSAKGRRGVTAWVERPGRLTLGDRLRLHVPDQPSWAFAADC